MKKTKRPRIKNSDVSIRNPAKYLFDFSNWQKMSGREFHNFRFNAHRFYYTETPPADLNNEIVKYMETNKYSKKDIAAVKRARGDTVTGVLCKLLRSGCPDYNPKHKEHLEALPGSSGFLQPITEYIKPQIEALIADGKDKVAVQTETKEAPVMSIQDKMRQQLEPLLSEIDEWVDKFLSGEDIKKFDPYKMMISFEPAIKPAHAKIIQQEYEKDIAESKIVLEGKDADYNEAFSHMKGRKIINYCKLLKSIYDSAQMIVDSGKQRRKPRKPKAVSAEKLVAKVKYKELDRELKITSVSPANIIDATEVWVYNTKYKKITQYVADPLIKTLTVKGTCIKGFDTAKSIQKTLRKPEEQLREFQKAGKVALRKFMDSLSTKESVPNGRLNEEILILKVMK